MKTLSLAGYSCIAFCVAILIMVSCTNITYAASPWTIEGDSSVSGTTGVAMPITSLQIVSTSTETVPVKLLVTSGTLSMTTTTGLTFTGSQTGSTLYFSGSLTNINNALATLRYTRNNVGTDTLEVSLVSSGEVFFADNGHLYEYVASTLTWTQAKSAAEARTKYGAAGYLTTITSQSENDFVAARLADAGWMGASDSGTEGTWKWVAGPENNTTFWSGTSGGSTVGGNYANWGSGEPNDYNNGNPGEDCAQFLSGGTGRWNDLPCTGNTLPGYVVEYGATGTLPTVAAKNVSITTTAAPTVTTLSPADNATGVALGSNLVMNFSAAMTTATGTVTLRKTADNSLIESFNASSSSMTGSGSTAITINPSSDFEESTSYYVIVTNNAFRNGSNVAYAGISASTTWNFTTGDFTAPVISAIATTTSTSTAGVTWTTNEIASTRVSYGTTQLLGSTTPLADISPRVTSHSASLSNLVPCALYFFKVVSADASSNTSTSTEQQFSTSGCVADTQRMAATSTLITSNVGGTTTLTETSTTIKVGAPQNFTSTSSTVAIQIQALSGTAILESIGKPRNTLSSVGSVVFDVKAIINSHTVLDSFDTPVTIEYQYSDSDVSGLDESSLKLYHYHNDAWLELDDCSVNTSTNTIVCTAPSFSIFSLFGTPISTSSSGSQTTRSSVASRATSLASMGMTKEADALKKQWPHLFANNVSVAATESAVKATPIAGTQTCKAPVITRELRYGSRGSDVKELQQFLNCAGFSLGESGAGAAGYETELFSIRTRNALMRFQEHFASIVLMPLGTTKGTGIYGNLSKKAAIENFK